MIHETAGGFVISTRDMWLPGIYETERAARFAFRMNPDQMNDLWEQKLREGKDFVTWQDIKDSMDKLKSEQS